MMSGPILRAIIAGPQDIEGQFPNLRWLAMHFGQDTDLMFESFGDALRAHLVTLSDANLRGLRSDLVSVIREAGSAPSDEPTLVKRYWIEMGAEWWDEHVPIREALKQVLQEVEIRLSGS